MIPSPSEMYYNLPSKWWSAFNPHTIYRSTSRMSSLTKLKVCIRYRYIIKLSGHSGHRKEQSSAVELAVESSPTITILPRAKKHATDTQMNSSESEAFLGDETCQNGVSTQHFSVSTFMG
jgi:hypothetical protein